MPMGITLHMPKKGLNKQYGKKPIINADTGVFALVAFLLISGLIGCVILGDTFRYWDEGQYYAIAKNLVSKGLYSTDGVHPTAYRPPGYPLLLSVLLFCHFDIVTLRFFNFLFLAGSVIILHKILSEHFTREAGLVAGFLTLFYPVLFYTAGTFYPQTFGAFLFLTYIWLVFRKGGCPFLYSLLTGLVMGLLVLTIPTFVFVFVLTFFFIIICRKNVKGALIMTLAACLVVTPWAVRNCVVFRTFVPFSTNSGWNLILGNSPNASANSGACTDISVYTSRASHLSETERDAYFRSEAIKWIMSNKVRAISLYFKKVLNYFNFRAGLATKSESSPYKEIMIFIPYYLLLSLTVLRFFFVKKYPFSYIEKYFVACYFANAFFQAIFYTRIRYRLPFDYLLIGLVAIFVCQFFPKFEDAQRSRERRRILTRIK